jgi:hypothetical protein
MRLAGQVRCFHGLVTRHEQHVDVQGRVRYYIFKNNSVAHQHGHRMYTSSSIITNRVLM